MIKNYILDTDVLLHFPGCILIFQNNKIITPLLCLEELDNPKNKEGTARYHVREAIREINGVRKHGNIHNEVVVFDIRKVVHLSNYSS